MYVYANVNADVYVYVDVYVLYVFVYVHFYEHVCVYVFCLIFRQVGGSVCMSVYSFILFVYTWIISQGRYLSVDMIDLSIIMASTHLFVHTSRFASISAFPLICSFASHLCLHMYDHVCKYVAA